MDPLRAAAATAGFACLASQLLGGAIKIKSLYGTIKNARSDVAELCLEMESLGSLLLQADSRLQNAAITDPELQNYQDAVRHCTAMRERSQIALKRLQTGLQKSRISALKMPSEKDDIKEMLISIERAKSSFLLAQQAVEIRSNASHAIRWTNGNDSAL